MERIVYTPLFVELVDSDSFFQEALEKATWARDLLSKLSNHSEWTFTHSVRVAHNMRGLGQHLNLGKEDILLLSRSGLLHDIGKLKIPKTILDSSSLNEEDRKTLEDHPRLGSKMIDPYDCDVARVIVAHHELQEIPYPRKTPRVLTPIPPVSFQQLLALADLTDALMSERPYKAAYSTQEASDVLLKNPNFRADLVPIAIRIRSNCFF